ncbi:hypothetical protein ACX2QB_02740 [Weissella viridescens]
MTDWPPLSWHTIRQFCLMVSEWRLVTTPNAQNGNVTIHLAASDFDNAVVV